MDKQECHNCQNTFEGKYCNSCGQRSIGNRRLQFREVVNDFFDNTFNLHKGFFFTFWNLIINPGKVGHAYINGQRKAYINPTRYLVIALAIQTFIDFWFKTPEIIKQQAYFKFSFLSEQINDSMEFWNVKLAVEYILLANIFQILVIPALFYLLFKSLKFNYTELLAANFYYQPTFVLIVMPILLITKVFFGIFLSKEIIIFLFLSYLFWSNLSFFKAIPFLSRLLKVFIAFVIFMALRIFLLPFILSLLFPIV